MPDSAGDFGRQAVAQLPRQHDDLPAMMAFVSHKISEHVADVERQVAPNVLGRRRNDYAVLAAKSPPRGQVRAAHFQRRHQFFGFHFVAIDALRHPQPVRGA